MLISPNQCRKAALVGLMLAGFVLLLAACGDPTPVPPTPTVLTTTVPTPLPITPTPPATGPVLPGYDNSNRLEMGGAFMGRFRQGLSGALGARTAGAHLDLYVTPDSGAQIETFYEGLMQRLSYQKIGLVDMGGLAVGQSATKGLLYATGPGKDAQAVLLVTVGPLRASDLSSLKTLNPEADVKIHPNNTLFELATGLVVGDVPTMALVIDPTWFDTPPNLPVYPMAKVVETGYGWLKLIKSSLVGLVGQTATDRSRVDLYLTGDAPQAALDFYKNGLGAAGYQGKGALGPATLQLFGRWAEAGYWWQGNGGGLLALAVGSTHRDEVIQAVPGVASQWPAGQTLLILVSGLDLSKTPDLTK